MNSPALNTKYLSLLGLKSQNDKGTLIKTETCELQNVTVGVFGIERLPISGYIYKINLDILTQTLDNLNNRTVTVELESDIKSIYKGKNIDEIESTQLSNTVGTLFNFTYEKLDDIILLKANFKPLDSFKDQWDVIWSGINPLTRFGLIGICHMDCSFKYMLNILRFQLLHDVNIEPLIEKLHSDHAKYMETL